MKEKYFELMRYLIPIIFMVSFGLVMYSTYINYQGGEEKCNNDCITLGKEYLDYKSSRGLFSADIEECWCVDNQESKRIW